MLMYGAGSIGRGFIGPLFASAGYEVIFVDINRELVDALNERKGYTLHVAADPAYDVAVGGVRAIDGSDWIAVEREIAECDIMATSLGAAVLPKAAPVIAGGLTSRLKQSGRPLDILLCENLKHSAERMREWLRDNMPPSEMRALDACGLVEAAIGRMVPVSTAGEDDPLRLVVEEYGFLPVDRDGFKGEIPAAQQLVPHTPFSYYEDRKLYLHNMGHAICAYLGMIKGRRYIAEAVLDAEVRMAVQSAMAESAAMLSARYAIPYRSLHAHMQDLLYRFANPALGDTCERVGRDPLRKLAADDRLAGAYQCCLEEGISPAFIGLGLAVALLRLSDDEDTARETAISVCGLDESDTGYIMTLFGLLRSGKDIPDVLRVIGKHQRRFYGNII